MEKLRTWGNTDSQGIVMMQTGDAEMTILPQEPSSMEFLSVKELPQLHSTEDKTSDQHNAVGSRFEHFIVKKGEHICASIIINI